MNNRFLEGPELVALSGNTKNLVIFMHGVGSNGNDLFELAPIIQRSMPDTHFISPNGLFAYDMANFGYQWFSLQDRRPEQMYIELQNIQRKIEDYIKEKLAQFKLTPENLALVGFSQGTMTALHVALRMEQQINCVVGFAGRLVAPTKLEQDIKSKIPICLIHGTHDDIIAVEAMGEAEQNLRSQHIDVQTHVIANLKHSIDSTALTIATNFLKTNLIR